MAYKGLKITNIALSALLFLIPTVFMQAETLNITINSATFIQSPDSTSERTLIRPLITFPDSSISIERAFLEFWVVADRNNNILIPIRISPITQEWDSTNTAWNYPWTSPGGSFDDNICSERLLTQSGPQRIRIDVTDMVMRWADGRLPYYGFIITSTQSARGHFSIINQPNGNRWRAILTISYTRIG